MFSRAFFRFSAKTAKFAPAAQAIFKAPGAKFVTLAGVSAIATGSLVLAAEPAPVNYEEVRKSIAALLDQENWDDGSLGPVFVRLAWHSAGTYDMASGLHGSNGATMRFAPESSDGANAGLNHARDFLEPIKARFPGLTYADLYVLAGVVAIQEMGGPKMAFRPGRTDAVDSKACPPNGRLPDALQGADHIRNVFYRMGMTDREIVALIGCHCIGRCHTDRSGFSGPWTRAPTTFSNMFFTELLEKKWEVKKWDGPKQYENTDGRDLMMLPADMALATDPEFRKYAEMYAKDEQLFFKDFAAAWTKLTENGVLYPQGDQGGVSSGDLAVLSGLAGLAVAFAVSK